MCNCIKGGTIMKNYRWFLPIIVVIFGPHEE
jgi:hypothetical protein